MIVSTLLALALTAAEPKADAPKNYSVDTQGTSKEVQAGKAGSLQLQIKAAEGHYISPEAPLKITLSSEGLELAKKALGHDDAKDKESKAPEFTVGFKAAATGEKTIAVDASFFLCSAKICEKKVEKLSVPVSVRP